MSFLCPVDDLLEDEEGDDRSENGRCCCFTDIVSQSSVVVVIDIRVKGEPWLAERVQTPSLDRL